MALLQSLQRNVAGGCDHRYVHSSAVAVTSQPHPLLWNEARNIPQIPGFVRLLDPVFRRDPISAVDVQRKSAALLMRRFRDDVVDLGL